MNTLQIASEFTADYEAAKAYYEANAAIKAAEKVKAQHRPRLEKETGKREYDGYEVNFSSHEEEVVDSLQLNAFLAKHGVSVDDFRVRKVKTRLTVTKV